MSEEYISSQPLAAPPMIEDLSAEIDSQVIPKMSFWYVCLYIPTICEKTKSGIVLTTQTQRDQSYVTPVGKIMAMGPKAFKEGRLRIEGDEDQIPRMGDWVLIGHLAGTRISTREGHQLRLISDSNIQGLIQDPNDFIQHI